MKTKKFSGIIRELRNEKHLKQTDVALVIGISPTGYASWEQGKSEPSIDFLIKLSDFYECSIDFILGREDECGGNLAAKKKALAPEKKSDIQRIFDRLPPFYQNRVLGYAQGILESIGA